MQGNYPDREARQPDHQRLSSEREDSYPETKGGKSRRLMARERQIKRLVYRLLSK